MIPKNKSWPGNNPKAIIFRLHNSSAGSVYMHYPPNGSQFHALDQYINPKLKNTVIQSALMETAISCKSYMGVFKRNDREFSHKLLMYKETWGAHLCLLWLATLSRRLMGLLRMGATTVFLATSLAKKELISLETGPFLSKQTLQIEYELQNSNDAN